MKRISRLLLIGTLALSMASCAIVIHDHDNHGKPIKIRHDNGNHGKPAKEKHDNGKHNGHRK